MNKALALARTGFRGIRVRCLPEIDIVLPLAAWRRYWDGLSPDTDLLQFLSARIPDGGTFVDVGANVGIYSAALAIANLQQIHCLAFEPIPTTVSVLERTLALNRIRHCEIVPLALSSGESTIRLSAYGSGANNFWVQEGNTSMPTVTVQTTALDWWLRARPEVIPSAIKVDVEGHELEVLKGAVETIRSCRPAMVVECHCASWDELCVSRTEFWDLVRSFGYRDVRARSGGPPDFLRARETIHLLLSA